MIQLFGRGRQEPHLDWAVIGPPLPRLRLRLGAARAGDQPPELPDKP
jgi:hypothetical protein